MPPTAAPTTGADVTARVDDYLRTASARDVEPFVRQWEYPVQDYYGEVGASEAFVRSKAETYFASRPSIRFTRTSSVTVTDAPGERTASFQYAFDVLSADNTRKCGVNTLTLVFADSAGYPIRRVSERTGARTC